MQINFATRELNLKLVYYGPGRSGKTTNLEKVHEKAPEDAVGELTSIATESDRTLFFDFLPLDLGKVSGMNTRFQLYTVPGQSYYKGTRKLVLSGCDGVIWVADSQRKMMAENLESLHDLAENLAENGLDINTIPLVLQWNKRDLEDIATVEEMNQQFNRWNAPNVEAIAFKGTGVFPTLKALASLVIRRANEEFGGSPSASAPKPAAQTAPAPQSSVAPVVVEKLVAAPVTPVQALAPKRDTQVGAITVSSAHQALPTPTPPPLQATQPGIPVAMNIQSPPPVVAVVPPNPPEPPTAVPVTPPAVGAASPKRKMRRAKFDF